MSTPTTLPYKSTAPLLVIPPGGFQSNLPPHLLVDCDPQTAYLLNEISKNTAATTFACEGVAQLSEYMRELNGKTAKTIETLEERRLELEVLNEKAKTMEPLFKPLAFIMGLWEYQAFRVACYLLAFFFFTYLLPFYIAHPLSLADLVSIFTGGH